MKEAETFIIVLLGLFLGLLWLRATVNGLPGWAAEIPLPPVIWVVLFIVGFSLGVYFLDYGRLYWYGVLYAISHPLRIVFKQNPELRGISLMGYFVSGGVMVFIGVVLFIRFLCDYPIPVKDSLAEEVFGGNY